MSLSMDADAQAQPAGKDLTKDNKSNYDFSNEKCRGVIWGTFACAESWFGGHS